MTMCTNHQVPVRAPRGGRIQVPIGDAAGTYVITATGMSADGSVRVDSTLITVAEPGGGTPPAPPGGGGGGH